MSELWVFAYGSLMWQPGFRHVSAHPALLTGYHRALCIYSTHYRGSPERPGLVLGLERGGSCRGLAYRVAGADAASVLHYLRARELIYSVYREMELPVQIGAGDSRVNAVTYVAESCHPRYAGHRPIGEAASLVRGASGTAGPNIVYLARTLERLRALGLRERDLERLGALAGTLAIRSALDGDCGGRRAGAVSRAWSRRCGWQPAHARCPVPGDPFGFRKRLLRGRQN